MVVEAAFVLKYEHRLGFEAKVKPHACWFVVFPTLQVQDNNLSGRIYWVQRKESSNRRSAARKKIIEMKLVILQQLRHG